MSSSNFVSKFFMALLTCVTSIELQTLTGEGSRLFKLLIFTDEEFVPLTADITTITSRSKTTLKQAANGQHILLRTTLCLRTKLFRERIFMKACRPFVFANLYCKRKTSIRHALWSVDIAICLVCTTFFPGTFLPTCHKCSHKFDISFCCHSHFVERSSMNSSFSNSSILVGTL